MSFHNQYLGTLSGAYTGLSITMHSFRICVREKKKKQIVCVCHPINVRGCVYMKLHNTTGQ